MKSPRSRVVLIFSVFLALMVLSLFILRASLNLMNQRSDLSLVLGMCGVAVTMLLWGLFIVKLASCKKGSITVVEPMHKEGEER